MNVSYFPTVFPNHCGKLENCAYFTCLVNPVIYALVLPLKSVRWYSFTLFALLHVIKLGYAAASKIVGISCTEWDFTPLLSKHSSRHTQATVVE